MNVGGIDPSFTCTGIATPDGLTHAIKFPKKPARFEQQQWKRYRAKIITAEIYSRLWSCDLAVVEGFSYGSRQGREDLGYLGHLVRDTLDDMRVPHIEVAPTALKKFATGSGTAKKHDMKSAATEHLSLDIDATDDEADALWLREVGLCLLDQTSTSPNPPPNIQLPKELLQCHTSRVR